MIGLENVMLLSFQRDEKEYLIVRKLIKSNIP